MPPRFIYPDQMKRLRLKAHQQGATFRELRQVRPGEMPVVLNSSIWSASGSCERPVLVTVKSRPELKRGKVMVIQPGKTELPTFADVHVRCRSCPACLRARAASWRLRALAEWRLAPRTWLVTLTFTPEFHYQALTILRAELAAQGADFDRLSPAEQFAGRTRICGHEVQNYFKRLRKAGHVFRYLMVAEAHKSGLPHYHVLLHERSAPIAHRAVKAAWSAGFSDAKLVTEPAGATYATKYLLKSTEARVRASLAYGALDDYALGHSDDGTKPEEAWNESPPNEGRNPDD